MATVLLLTAVADAGADDADAEVADDATDAASDEDALGFVALRSTASVGEEEGAWVMCGKLMSSIGARTYFLVFESYCFHIDAIG